MPGVDMRKIYKFYPVEPTPSPDNLPTGGDLYYECTDCGEIVLSVPRVKSACACGNLSGQGGRLQVRDTAKVRVVRGKLK
ncbi:MAG: hypothetical protein FWG81_05200 [Betaproteobacteria bacterium]|nr:hypothetical protein [Betaproteobacteria bacterium]